MELSVVILNYNVQYFLQICLESVFKAISNLSAEVIVVDNNSSDGSIEMIKSNFPEVVLIANQTNLGFARANNQAVKVAQGKYVCILNPDTIVAEDTFLQCVEFYKSKNNIGLLGVQLVDGKGKFLPESKRNLPTPKVSFFKIFGSFLSGLAPYYSGLNDQKVGEVEILVGAFMFCETNNFISLGGFDERYFMYGEDIDLSYTFRLNGFENYYLGTTSVVHFKGESSLKNKVYRKRFYGAMKLFYAKYFKSYKLVNWFVFLGIRIASNLTISSSQNKDEFQPKRFFLISKNRELKLSLQNSLCKPIQMISSISDCNTKEALVFFDTNYLTFKDLITTLKLGKKTNHSFRLISRKNNFAIGSDLSTTLGSVILLPNK